MTKSLSKVLIASVLLNLFFLTSGIYLINKRGGIEYLKNKIHPAKKTDPMEFYYQVKNSEFQLSKGHNKEILFIGDSLTDNCDWYELFNNKDIKNRGIQGDDINGVLNRIDGLKISRPKKIFLMIGINDIIRSRQNSQILINYEKLINSIHEKSPHTNLYIQSILPTYDYLRVNNTDITIINNGLLSLAKKHNLIYIDLFKAFKNKEGKLDMVYSFDGLHLNGQGYQLWKTKINQYVQD